jgi:hypothetical protein
MRFILFICTLCLITFYSCGNTKAQQNTSGLQFQDTIDIGLVNFRDTAQVNQPIFNPAHEEVKIVGISASCGCVDPYLSDSIIEPRQTSVMRINYIPTVSNDSGAFTKIISFRTNEERPFKTFIIKGEVKK